MGLFLFKRGAEPHKFEAATGDEHEHDEEEDRQSNVGAESKVDDVGAERSFLKIPRLLAPRWILRNGEEDEAGEVKPSANDRCCWVKPRARFPGEVLQVRDILDGDNTGELTTAIILCFFFFFQITR